MEVKIYAFELNFRYGIDVNQLFNHISQKGDKDRKLLLNYLQKKSGERPRISSIITTSNSTANQDYLLGLSLNIKDISAFCRLTAVDGKLSLSAEQLVQGSLMTDFNFFIIYKPTGRGLYQHYHQSQATTVFCGLLKSYYSSMRKGLVELEKQEIMSSEGRSEKAAHRQAAKKYFRFLDTNVIARPGDIQDYILELNSINRLDFESQSFDNFNKFGKPSDGVLKRVKNTIFFEKTPDLVTKAKEFAAGLFTPVNQIKSATVKGVDINGNEATIKLNNDYQVLHSYEYDDFVLKVSLNDLTASLDDSKVLKELLDLSQSKRIKGLLETPAK